MMSASEVWIEAKRRHEMNPSKCFQRYVREVWAEVEPREPLASLDGARVEKISKAEAAELILRYEWLRTCGCGASAFYGLRIGGELLGVEIFGTGTSHEARNICGPKYISQTVSLMRGCCVHYAPKNAPSFLVRSATRQAAADYGWKIFIAYADEEAGELGQIYRAVGWRYIGEGLGRPNGRVHLNWRKPDGTEISSQAAHHQNLTKKQLFASGYRAVPVRPKKKFVWFEGSRAQRRELGSKCRHAFLDYPKRSFKDNGI